jgi:hypothetical protein
MKWLATSLTSKLINFGEHVNQLLIEKYNFHIKLKSDLQAET